MIKIGSQVIIRDNLCVELEKLGFDNNCINRMKKYIKTKQKVHDIWNDDNYKYATIDLCIEIPLQCLQEIN